MSLVTPVWNAHFPSAMERIMWRISVCMVGIGPATDAMYIQFKGRSIFLQFILVMNVGFFCHFVFPVSF